MLKNQLSVTGDGSGGGWVELSQLRLLGRDRCNVVCGDQGVRMVTIDGPAELRLRPRKALVHRGWWSCRYLTGMVLLNSLGDFNVAPRVEETGGSFSQASVMKTEYRQLAFVIANGRVLRMGKYSSPRMTSGFRLGQPRVRPGTHRDVYPLGLLEAEQVVLTLAGHRGQRKGFARWPLPGLPALFFGVDRGRNREKVVD